MIAYSPGWCLVIAGANDLLQNVAKATIQTNLASIITTLRNARIRVIVGTIPPNSNLTGSAPQDRRDINRWLIQTARTTPGVYVCDWNPYVTDPATGNWPSAYSTDGTHPLVNAAVRMGYALSQTLTAITPPAPLQVASDVDTANLLGHPTMTGTGGSKDASVTGTVATGWAVWESSAGATPTATATAGVAATDGSQDVWQQLVFNAGNTCQYYLQQQIAAPGGSYAVGDYLYGEIEVQLPGDWTTPSRLFLALVFTGPNSDTTYDLKQIGADPALGYAINGNLILRTPPLQVPAGTTATQLQVMVKATTGTIRFRRGGIYKGSAPVAPI